MDLVRVETRNQILFSFLSVGWGLLADIDIESERLRALGGQRFAVWGVARLIGLRTYKGKVSYLPYEKLPPSSENNQTNVIYKDNTEKDEVIIPHAKSFGDQLDRWARSLYSFLQFLKFQLSERKSIENAINTHFYKQSYIPQQLCV